MPISDAEAKRWQSDQAARFGRAVQARRQDLGLSVAQVADRTNELGYPIHRVALGKIESNNRAGKVDLAEIAVLADALELAAIELIYPPEVVEVERLPGASVASHVAAARFSRSKHFEAVAALASEIETFMAHFELLLKYNEECAGLEDAGRGGSEQHRRAVQLHDLAERSVVATGEVIERLYAALEPKDWPGPADFESFGRILSIVRQAERTRTDV